MKHRNYPSSLLRYMRDKRKQQKQAAVQEPPVAKSSTKKAKSNE